MIRLLLVVLLIIITCVPSAVFRPPEITGETIVNEGDMLDLDCDSSNSRPNPSVQWFNAEGDMITSDRKLNITNIQQNEMGIYTCVATQLGITMNNSVNVIVQCECVWFDKRSRNGPLLIF